MNRRAIQSLAGSLILSVSVAFVAPSFWWGGVAFGACLMADIVIASVLDYLGRPGVWNTTERR